MLQIFTPELRPALGKGETPLTEGSDHREVELDDVDVSADCGRRMRIDGCRWRKVTAIGLELTGLQAWHFEVESSDFSGAWFDAASFHRCAFGRTKFRGAILNQTEWKHVTIEDGVLDDAQLRGAKFSNVRFRRCRLMNADFFESHFEQVEFDDCDLRGVSFENARMRGVDLTTSNIGGLRSAAGLSGATITMTQAIAFADRLAAALGITVVEG